MNLAKVSANGQVTVPVEIRRRLDLKKGDKIMFFEDNGKYFFQNSLTVALKNIQKTMKGEAGRVGFNTPDDVVKYIKSRRKIRNK